jgi:hypothetical protein
VEFSPCCQPPSSTGDDESPSKKNSSCSQHRYNLLWIAIYGFLGRRPSDISKIDLNHREISNVWYIRHHHSSTSCKVSLPLLNCPKASIAAPQAVHAYYIHIVCLPQSRGQHVLYPQTLIGDISNISDIPTSCFSGIHRLNADNTSLRVIGAVICPVSRHSGTLPHPREQHLCHCQACMEEKSNILTLGFSKIRNCHANNQPSPPISWTVRPIIGAYT